MSAPVTIPAALAADVLGALTSTARRARRAAKRAEHRWSVAPTVDADDARAEADRLDRSATAAEALAQALAAAIAEANTDEATRTADEALSRLAQ